MISESGNYKVNLTLSLLLGFCLGLSNGLDLKQESFEPRVFPGRFQEFSQVNAIAINPDMSLVYDNSTAALVAVWQGPIQMTSMDKTGSVYEFLPGNVIYHRQYKFPVWTSVKKGKSLKVQVLFQSVQNSPEKTEIKYDLLLNDKHTVNIVEIPVFDDHYGAPSLYRTFKIKGLPKGAELRLLLSGGLVQEEWSAAGASAQVKQIDGKTWYVVAYNEECRVKGTWAP